jgi:LEA14-like dessication related protein
MRRKTFILIYLSVFVVATLLMGCAGMVTKPTEKNFKAPIVTLSHVEVENYWGWWYYSKKVEPTKGTAGDYGAPVNLAFIFNIENPNEYPVMMENFQFTMGFEEFDLNTVISREAMWIPAGKTNEIRVHSLSDARQALLSLLVTGGFKLKEQGISPWDALEKWWTDVPEFGFQINIREGAALFSADGIMKSVVFDFTFP